MALILQWAPIMQPITSIRRPRHPWEQFDPSGMVTKQWQDFFRYATAILNTAPQVIGDVNRTGLAASVAATVIATTFPTLPNARLLPGLYLVTTYARVTQAATTSSSLQVSVRFVDGGVTITRAGTAQTGNTTDTTDHNTWMVRVDTETEIRYLTTYASVGATPMTYRLDIKVYALPEAA